MGPQGPQREHFGHILGVFLKVFWMYFVAHDLQRPKQITGASQMQEKHRGAAVSRHAFSIKLDKAVRSRAELSRDKASRAEASRAKSN